MTSFKSVEASRNYAASYTLKKSNWSPKPNRKWSTESKKK